MTTNERKKKLIRARAKTPHEICMKIIASEILLRSATILNRNVGKMTTMTSTNDDGGGDDDDDGGGKENIHIQTIYSSPYLNNNKKNEAATQRSSLCVHVAFPQRRSEYNVPSQYVCLIANYIRMCECIYFQRGSREKWNAGHLHHHRYDDENDEVKYANIHVGVGGLLFPRRRSFLREESVKRRRTLHAAANASLFSDRQKPKS